MNWQASFSFKLKFLMNSCKQANALIGNQFRDITYYLSAEMFTKNVSPLDFYNVPNYSTGLCGALSLIFTPVKDFISFDGSKIAV